MIFRYLLQFAHHANGNVVIISKSQPSLIIYLYYIILYLFIYIPKWANLAWLLNSMCSTL
jgi:hypothetical protein